MGWQIRKEGYPRIWADFTCENSKQRFIIKDLSEEYYDIALGYMTNIFLKESVIRKPLRVFDDSVSRLKMQQKWLNIMRSNMAIICCTVDDEVSRVAGIHLTAIRKNGQEQLTKDQSFLNEFEQLTQLVEDLISSGNLFQRFDSDLYLFSSGLFVLHEFRGLGIATQLLKCRITMCQTLGLRGTANVFSTPGAQAAAKSAGYEEIAYRVYKGHRLALMGTAVQ